MKRTSTNLEKASWPLPFILLLIAMLSNPISLFSQDFRPTTIFWANGYVYDIYNTIGTYGPEFDYDKGFGSDCWAECRGRDLLHFSESEDSYIRSTVPLEETFWSETRIVGSCPVLCFNGWIHPNHINVSFPANIQEIKRCRFPDSVLSVTLPPSIKYIPNNFLSGANEISSISIPDGVERIGRYCCFFSSKLKSIHLSSHLKTIEDDCFRNIDSLETIEIPDEVEKIGSWCFYKCEKLKKVHLGKNLKRIKEYPFNNDDNIIEVVCDAPEPPILDGPFESEVYENATLIVPPSSKDKYMQAQYWKEFFIREGNLDIEAYTGHLADGQQAYGVTADGESQLRFVVSLNDENFTVKDYEIIVLVDGEEVSSDVAGTFSNFGIQDNGKWGFIYTAPQAYPEKNHDSSFDVSVSVKLTSTNNKVVTVKRNITVARPGLILLHGFNSDPSYLIDVQHYLLDNGYNIWQIYNTNYSSYHHLSLDAIQQKRVVENAIDDLSLTMLNLYGIVSSKYDMVGHSMGGLVARKFAQSENNALVNRIITLDTPHYGSELANIGKDDVIPAISKALGWISAYPFRNKTLGSLLGNVFTQISNKMTSGNGSLAAIGDLCTNSSSIQSVNNSSEMMRANGIPVHAICSYMIDEEVSENMHTLHPEQEAIDSYEGMLSFFNIISSESDIIDDKSLLASVFGGANDGIVSYTSQAGGLTGAHVTKMVDKYLGYFGTESWAHHNKTNHWEKTIAEISDLLYSSPQSSRYATSFVSLSSKHMPSPRKASAEDIEFKEASDGTHIKLSVTKSDPERTVNVHVDKSDDIKYSVVFSFLDADKMLIGSDSSDYVFKVPEVYEGTLEICALGRTQDFAFVADTASVYFERTSQPLFLMFDGGRNKTMIKNQSLIPNVLAGWSMGETDYVLPDYSCSPDGILTSNDGVITAVSEGECDLIASYEGMADTIHVSVIAPTGNAIRKINCPDSEITLSYYNNQLVILFNSPYSGVLEYEVYDMAGIRHMTELRNVNVSSNERVFIDLSKLNGRIFFVNVATKNGKRNLKIVK